MFQKYKMKYDGSFNSVRGYTYKNCSIAFSENGGLKTVSICPHGAPTPKLPDEDKINGILEYLGLDISKPIDHSIVQHIGIPSFGDTQYYSQRARGAEA